MFGWFETPSSPPLEPVKPPSGRWIGNVYACYVDGDTDFRWKFWFQLFVDDDDTRTYRVTGHLPLGNKAEHHGVFSKVIAPWQFGADLGYLWPNLEGYDLEYWAINGFRKLRDPPKAAPEPEKPEFKLLKFPKDEEAQAPELVTED